MAGLRANRSSRLLWTGATASTLGDYVFDTTMVLWIGIVVARGRCSCWRCFPWLGRRSRVTWAVRARWRWPT